MILLQRGGDPLLDLPFHRRRILADEHDNDLFFPGEEKIVDDLGGPGVPVQDHCMTGDPQSMDAGSGVLNELGNVVCDVADDGAGEGDHPQDHRKHAHNDQPHARLADVFNDELDAPGVQDHADGVKHRGPESPVLQGSGRQRGNDAGGDPEQDEIQDQDGDQDGSGRILDDEYAERFSELSEHGGPLSTAQSVLPMGAWYRQYITVPPKTTRRISKISAFFPRRLSSAGRFFKKRLYRPCGRYSLPCTRTGNDFFIRRCSRRRQR